MFRIFRASRRLGRLAIAIFLARRESKGLAGLTSRAAWQQRQAARMLKALEIEVSISGRLPREGLVVSNHLSYLDVLVIAAQGSVVFVAKSDVLRWPVIGNLLESAGTILAERGKPLTAGKTAGEMGNALGEGLPVILFPEGTSSDGSSVLPFKPTLLQAALDAGVSITPTAITYQADGGNVGEDVCYWGDATFFPHLARLAGLRNVVAELRFGIATDLPPDRKTAARQLHEDTSSLLAGLNAARTTLGN